MCAVVLPTAPVKATRIDPAIFIMYGAKKIGKTKLISELPGCLILDGENGTDEIDALKLKFNSIRSLYEIHDAIKAEGQRRFNENKAAREAKKEEPYPGDAIFPYRYIALDTIDVIEDMVVPDQTRKYKKTKKGGEFEGENILELDFGLGYKFVREGVKEVIFDFASVCKNLIIISHLDEKVQDKGGMSVVSKEISLSGKLAGIVCAMANAIGYISRKPSNQVGVVDPIDISFKTTEGITMGARTKHLYGQSFRFDWAKIYTEDPALKKDPEPGKSAIARSTESA